MKLTRASSYALHAVAYMAQQKSDKPIASHKIAEERKIPDRFLLKVLKPLVSQRVLKSIKGPNGGYQLARPATDITMLEIIEAVEQGRIQGQAPWDGKSHPGINTKLDSICGECADAVRKTLEKVRISDLIAKGDGKKK